MEEIKDTVVDDKPQVINADLRKFNRSEQMIKKAITALDAITVTNQEQCDAAMVTLKEAKTVENTVEAKRKDLVKPFNDAVKKINDYAKTLMVIFPVAIDGAKKKVLDWQREELKKSIEKRSGERVAFLISLGMEKWEDTGGKSVYKYGDSVRVENFMIETFDDQLWTSFIENVSADINSLKASELKKLQSQQDDVAMFGTEEEAKKVSEKIEQLQQPATPKPWTGGSGSSAGIAKGTTKRWTFEVMDPTLVPTEYLIVDEVKIRKAVQEGSRNIPGVRIFQQEGLTIR